MRVRVRVRIRVRVRCWGCRVGVASSANHALHTGLHSVKFGFEGSMVNECQDRVSVNQCQGRVF